MKRKLELTLWAIGTFGAVLFTCFFGFATVLWIVQHRQGTVDQILRGALVGIGLASFGAYLVREGVRTFRETKNAE